MRPPPGLPTTIRREEPREQRHCEGAGDSSPRRYAPRCSIDLGGGEEGGYAMKARPKWGAELCLHTALAVLQFRR